MKLFGGGGGFLNVLLKQGSSESWDALCMESGDEGNPLADEVHVDVVHVEHPYFKDSNVQTSRNGSKGKSEVNLLSSKSEPYFRRYDALEKYLRTGVYSSTPYCTRYMVRRCAKHFCLEGKLSCLDQREGNPINGEPV